MIKYIDIEPYDSRTGAKNVTVYTPGVNTALEKTANVSDEIEKFLETLKPDPDHSYLLINAMGADEYYGCNANGDGFPEKALKQYYPTFKETAKVFQLHKNKDGDPQYGSVMFAFYNPRMHRVELVLDINRRSDPALAERIDGGEMLPFSMGCKVPYDECSNCHNRAKTRAQYCEHLQPFSIKTVDPYTGKKNYAINDTDLKFFDISIVRRPADRTAYAMRKVAEEGYIDEEEIGTQIANYISKDSGLLDYFSKIIKK